MGASDVEYSGSGPAHTFPALLKWALQTACADIDWQVHSALLYPTDTMASRAEMLVERFGANAVMVVLGTNTFTEKKVVYAVRERVPGLYGVAHALSRVAKMVAGGGAVGSSSPRGWGFRAPQMLAVRLIGIAPLIRPETAYAATRKTIDYLGTLSDVRVVCSIVSGNCQQPEQATAVARAAQDYCAEVESWCDAQAIVHYDQKAEIEAHGAAYGMAPDLLHFDLPTRTLSADHAARRVLSALGLTESSGTREGKVAEI
jgi:hypothetical protein